MNIFSHEKVSPLQCLGSFHSPFLQTDKLQVDKLQPGLKKWTPPGSKSHLTHSEIFLYRNLYCFDPISSWDIYIVRGVNERAQLYLKDNIEGKIEENNIREEIIMLSTMIQIIINSLNRGNELPDFSNLSLHVIDIGRPAKSSHILSQRVHLL